MNSMTLCSALLPYMHLISCPSLAHCKFVFHHQIAHSTRCFTSVAVTEQCLSPVWTKAVLQGDWQSTDGGKDCLRLSLSQAHYTHFWLSDSEFGRCKNALSTAVTMYTSQEEHTAETYTVSHLRISYLKLSLLSVTMRNSLRNSYDRLKRPCWERSQTRVRQSINCLGSDLELGLIHCNNQCHACFWCKLSGMDEWCRRNWHEVKDDRHWSEERLDGSVREELIKWRGVPRS